MRLNASSSSFEPQFDTSATGWRAAPIRRRASSSAAATVTGRPFSIGSSARVRSKIRARSRPLLQIHGPFTAGFSSGVMRAMLVFCRWSSDFRNHSGLRCQTWIVQPRAQPGHTDGVGFRYQTRDLCRNCRDCSAPTGQMSTMLSEYGSSPSGRSSTGRMFETSPRRSTPSAMDFEISCVKRVQRRHRMQRSLSSRMRFDRL